MYVPLVDQEELVKRAQGQAAEEDKLQRQLSASHHRSLSGGSLLGGSGATEGGRQRGGGGGACRRAVRLRVLLPRIPLRRLVAVAAAMGSPASSCP